MEKIKYSVILPVYNVEKYLHRCLNCLLNQNYSNYEIILVDDGSTDKSGIICDSYSEKYKNVHVIHQKNQGSGIARQTGINFSTGEYLCFFDPDDVIENGVFEKNLKIINKYKPDVIFNGYKEIRKDFRGQVFLKHHIYNNAIYLQGDQILENFDMISQISIRSLWNKIYRKEFLLNNKIYFTQQKIGQDALFNFEVYKYLSSLYISTESFYQYDSTIEDSSVKKYRPYRFLYELRIYNKLKKVFEYSEKEGEFESLINRNLWFVYFYSVENLIAKDCPYTLVQKIKFQSKLRNSKIFEKLFKLKNSEIELNLLHKTVFIFEKYGLYPLSMMLIFLYHKVYIKLSI